MVLNSYWAKAEVMVQTKASNKMVIFCIFSAKISRILLFPALGLRKKSGFGSFLEFWGAHFGLFFWTTTIIVYCQDVSDVITKK